ncbi:hypothetical protein GA0061078_1058 [Bifidobacterium bohemicum]|uniref:Uncharacterized protein n=1 Tax=Bifidobacterium bohemicum DSM 22767 TaxID=1437606 RepID=A0A086ZEG0_9BIFI|nr:hypothetical protein [Bifidobacterium bohemicum]KFI44910.1 hypothetical protein BBOH_1641 [Bifidobacterium bohemicum DSM 22767]SCB97129.1 hypothetical protein GA0061078_1058 [Bifidobacterium bohemicum]
MSSVEKTSSHGKLLVVVAAAAAVIVVALLSAFIWPGWALSHSNAPAPDPQTNVKAEPATPSIKAKDLPKDATALLKAMPDNVLNYARTEAVPSAEWTATSPLEEYTLTYSTGDETQNITLIVAQWPNQNGAKSQYTALTGALKGDDISTGPVKVSGNTTGEFVMKTAGKKGKEAVAVSQNDTVVFQATGPKKEIVRFFGKFPL